jgi:hypothetical protein
MNVHAPTHKHGSLKISISTFFYDTHIGTYTYVHVYWVLHHICVYFVIIINTVLRTNVERMNVERMNVERMNVEC